MSNDKELNGKVEEDNTFMNFTSMSFIWIFLPAIYFLYILTPSKGKNVILLIASLLFYAWGEPVYIILMLFSVVMNYFFGLGIEHTTGRYQKKLVLILSIICNLTILGYFKYAGFVVENISAIFGWKIAFTTPILPIGISFFTFRALSYVMDVYAKNKGGQSQYAQRNIFRLALYITFFPQVLAGPIAKYHEFEDSLSKRLITLDDTLIGIKRFIFGLSKKVLIANVCAQAADNVFSLEVNTLPTLTAWVGIFCYTLQIYFDFSGYSDMAIGIGKMLGFTFSENFNFPYAADSIRDFWQKWHISLSTWFKEYLYFPLGGNRRGKARTYINLLLVFFATGIWHGASWNFVIWGLFHGGFLVIEKIFLGDLLKKNKIKPLNHIYTWLVVMIGWVLFRASTLPQAILYLKAMFTWSTGGGFKAAPQMILDHQLLIILVCGFILCGPFQSFIRRFAKSYKILQNNIILPIFTILLSVILLVLSIVSLAQGTYNAFIYFKF